MKDQETELEEAIQAGTLLRFTLSRKLAGKQEIRGTINWFDNNYINITTDFMEERRKVTLNQRYIVGYHEEPDEKAYTT
ncbi:MAG: hypothetical protein ACOCZX_03400 [Candidatus Bipolaricaulota bacterium]